MNIVVENLALDYEQLAKKVLSINQSYLKLLSLYKELSLSGDLLRELHKSGNPTLQVIESMKKDKQKLDNDLNILSQDISQNLTNAQGNDEIQRLQDIIHDCKVMQKFLNDINIQDLQMMFAQLEK